MHDFPERPQPPLKIAISECLLGFEVRYDGSSAVSSFPQRALEEVFTYLPICPEVGIGMGVPRDPIRLIGDPRQPSVVMVDNPNVDKTAELECFGRNQCDYLADVAGYVFMQSSPSCGLFQVPVYPRLGHGPPSPTGRGIYARTITDAYPEMPVEEGGRLFDAVLRMRFVERVFQYAHWQRIVTLGSRDEHVREFKQRYSVADNGGR